MLTKLPRSCSWATIGQVPEVPGHPRAPCLVWLFIQVRHTTPFSRHVQTLIFTCRGDRNGPPALRRLSKLLSRKLTAWQTIVITFLWLYVARNFDSLLGLESPEPLANLYNRSYFRATWVTTALDAGFWTAMRIKPKWARDACSMVFSIYYLFAATQADEKVRKVRGMLTVEHLRVSWDKPLTPYLKFITTMMRPRFMSYEPRKIRIMRSHASAYKEPIDAWLYFNGPIADMKHQDKVVLDCPGGGFVAMSPRTHDDKLMCWAGKTGIPVVSLDYKKAPEFPYPYALNECYDAYFTIMATRGKVIGMSGETTPRVVLSGDSAGGNLAVGALLMILQAGSFSVGGYLDEPLPIPESLLLIYPALDVNIGNWMTDEQMALINDRRSRKINKAILSRKSADYYKMASTPYASDDEFDDEVRSPKRKNPYPGDESAVTVIAATDARKDSVHPAAAHIPAASSTADVIAKVEDGKPKTMATRLAMSSMISYFNDRILTPEMMRAMIILYIGPHNRPDFSTDFLLSPLLAPDSLLARFPKTYILTGERDPLVDDTVVFAGRLRQAHRSRHIERQEVGAIKRSTEFNERDVVEVALIPGISHGFLQFPGVFPEGWTYINRCADWILDSFHDSAGDTSSNGSTPALTPTQGVQGVRPLSTWNDKERHHHRTLTDSSDGEFDNPLEMSRLSPSSTSLVKKSQASSSGSSTNQSASPKKPSKDSKVAAENLLKRRAARLGTLKSTEDLLGRRMKGLAGGLMGSGEIDAPPTP
jgi:acetyl esterase/lipase